MPAPFTSPDTSRASSSASGPSKVANRIGVNGWVCNRKDGNVEIYLDGESNQLKQFIAEVRKGSPASRVDDVKIVPAKLERVGGFMRRATV